MIRSRYKIVFLNFIKKIMKDIITMKKILSLFLASLYFATQASFMDKVKALPGKAKEFGITTINAAKANKKVAFLNALQIGIIGYRVYTEKKLTNYKLFCVDKNNLLSTAISKPLGIIISKFYDKEELNEENYPAIFNKGITPLTYAQNLFNNGYGFTIGLLQFLKRLAL